MIFQSSWQQHRPYLDAIQRGLVADSVIDAAVTRVLRAKFELGLFEHPYADPTARRVQRQRGASGARARRGARIDRAAATTREAYSRSIATVRSVAVIGNGCGRGTAGWLQRPGRAARVDPRGDSREGGYLGAGALCAGAGAESLASTWWCPPARSPGDSAGRATRGLRGEYFDNNRLQGSPRAGAHRPAHRLRLDTELAGDAAFPSTGTRCDGPGISPRLPRVCATSGSRGTTAIVCTSTARW